MSFDKVFTQGTLVDINIRVWRAKISLKAEELGLTDKDIPKYYVLGQKLLIPEKVLKPFFVLEDTARRLLITYSYSFAFGNARFVPKKCLLEFIGKYDELTKKFYKERDLFLLKYDTHKLEMREHFTEAANISYNNAVSIMKHQHKELDMTADEYKNNYIQSIEMCYPTPEELINKFKMDYNVFQVALPDLTQVTYSDITEENSKIRLLENTQKKQLLRKVDMFFAESIMEIRSRVITGLDRFEHAINGKHNQSSFNRLKNIFDVYEKMCFFDDKEFLTYVKIFTEKCLEGYTSRMVWQSEVVKKSLLDEVSRLKSKAKDRVLIDNIIKGFREKMNI